MVKVTLSPPSTRLESIAADESTLYSTKRVFGHWLNVCNRAENVTVRDRCSNWKLWGHLTRNWACLLQSCCRCRSMKWCRQLISRGPVLALYFNNVSEPLRKKETFQLSNSHYTGPGPLIHVNTMTHCLRAAASISWHCTAVATQRVALFFLMTKMQATWASSLY